MTALFPDPDWDHCPADVLDGDLQAAVARAGRRGAAALMVVHQGQVIASRGDLAAKLDMASARKSLISALYGILVGEGAIDVNTSIGAFDVDDNDPLTDAEKRATIRDLLLSSSGVYRPAAAEGLAMKLKRSIHRVATTRIM